MERVTASAPFLRGRAGAVLLALAATLVGRVDVARAAAAVGDGPVLLTQLNVPLTSAGLVRLVQWAASSNSAELVRLFDFDERPRGNYEDTPMHWRRLEGPGLPAYSAGRFDDTVGHAAAPAFAFHVRGGSVAYAYERDDVILEPRSDYEVQVYVRAQQLTHARAALLVYFRDEAGRRIAGSERVAAYSALDATVAQDWQKLSIFLASQQATLVRLGLELWVLQDYAWVPANGTDAVQPQAMNARVWFDDLAIRRVPRVRLRPATPGGIFVEGTAPRLVMEVQHGLPAALTAELVVNGAAATPHFTQQYSLAPGQPHLEEIALAPLPVGRYTATLTVSADATALLLRHATFVVVPDDPAPAYGDDLGVDLGVWTDADPDAAAALLADLSVGAVKIGLPLASADDPTTVLGRRQVGLLARVLAARGTRTVGVLGSPATDGTGASQSLADVLAHDSDWPQNLSTLLMELGGLMDVWQLGSAAVEARAGGAGADRGRQPLHAALLHQLSAPALLTPRSIYDAPLAPWLGATRASANVPALAYEPFVDYWVPDDVPAQAYPWQLAFLSSPSGPQPVWLTLSWPGSAADDPSSVVELLHKLVLAKAAGPQRVYVPAPATISNGGGAPTWEATELYVPVRTLLRALSGARPVTALQLPYDSVGFVFDQGDSYTLVLWTWQQTERTPPLELYAGDGVVARDPWGQPWPIETQAGVTRLALTQTPLLLRNVAPELLLLQESLRVEPDTLEIGAPAWQPFLVLRNAFKEDLAATVDLEVPAPFEIFPRQQRIEVPAGQTLRLPLELKPPPRRLAGALPIGVTFTLQRPLAGKWHFTPQVQVRLRGLDVEVRAWIEGDVVVVEQTLRNESSERISFDAFCQPPGRRALHGAFLNVAPGDLRVLSYRLRAAAELRGQQLWTGIQEIGGRRGLDQLVAVPD